MQYMCTKFQESHQRKAGLDARAGGGPKPGVASTAATHRCKQTLHVLVCVCMVQQDSAWHVQHHQARARTSRHPADTDSSQRGQLRHLNGAAALCHFPCQAKFVFATS